MEHSSIEAGAQIEAGAPQLRTLEAMLEAMREAPAPDPQREQGVIPIRPTLPTNHSQLAAEKPFPMQAEAQPRAPVLLLGPNIRGATEGGEPAYPHGAIGFDQFVEVSVSEINIFPRSNPALRTRITLSAFFGNPSLYPVQPRVVYDSTQHRWIVTAYGRDAALRQFQLLAVSTSSNGLGPYYVYAFYITFNPTDFYGFVQLGMDHDAIILTADIYATGSRIKNAEVFAIAKERLYNGLGFSVPVFTGLRGTLAPPIVLDQNPNTYLITAASGSGNSLSMYTLTHSGSPSATALSGPVDIPVPAYSAPPPAPQPGGSSLDTFDGRFVNASTQTGNFLWQVHTINLVGYAAPKFYQIDTAAHAVVRSAFFFGTPTSFDFNASIAANRNNDIFVTWSMTDPARDTQVQVRFSGFDHKDGPVYVLGPGAAAYTSPTSKVIVDWGYYSAVTIDPRNPRRAWLVNEDIEEGGGWGTRIVGFGFAT